MTFGEIRRAKSCEGAAQELLDYLTVAVDGGMCCIAVFCDPSETFITINHDRPVCELRYMGLSGPAIFSLELYLCNRNRIFIDEGLPSLPAVTSCGFQQGGCLGSLLFLIYLNDLVCLNLTATKVTFAAGSVFAVRGGFRELHEACLLDEDKRSGFEHCKDEAHAGRLASDPRWCHSSPDLS